MEGGWKCGEAQKWGVVEPTVAKHDMENKGRKSNSGMTDAVTKREMYTYLRMTGSPFWAIVLQVLYPNRECGRWFGRMQWICDVDEAHSQ